MPKNELEGHPLEICMLVTWNGYLDFKDIVKVGDEICEQGYADLKYNGINHD